MATFTAPFQSRWGYHPCDRELFRILKRLHKWYWQTVYDFHRWHRWWRKQAQNRTGPEPRYCPSFIKDRPWYKRVRVRGVDGFKVYPKEVSDDGIVALFRLARTPQPEPVESFGEAIEKKVRALYSDCAAYFGE